MNFNEFVNEVKDNIKLFLPEEYENVEVSTMECQQLNRAYTGLMVRKEGEMLTPTINLNQLYEAYKAQPGVTMETVCRKIADIVIEAPIQVDLKAILNYEDVKDKLFIRVSSAEANKEVLENAPHQLKEDLAITYHVAVGKDQDGLSSMFIKNDLLEQYPQYLAGFIRINTSGALITMETENYQIDGKKGNWIATDTIIIDGKQFYLMEHQVYRDQAQGVILDAYGKMVVEECKKFDEKTKQKIHDYIQQQVPLNPVEQLKQDGKIRLEHYQKFYQNGTYERSRESGTEANYDMVDGLVNNQKKNLEKISDARNNKQTSRNQQNNKPKKRRSVIKRLHQKQIAIARRSGKPIPKYLDQEMERKRG